MDKTLCILSKWNWLSCCLKLYTIYNSDLNLLMQIVKKSPFSSLLPGMIMIVGMTVAAKTHATSSPSPSPSSQWVWANSSSPRLRHPPLFPQQLHRPVTLETAYFLCHNAWGYASIMRHAGCIFMTQTPWGAFMRGRWIVREQCIQLLASWVAARFNWKSSSLPRGWPFEEGWRLSIHWDLHLFNYPYFWRSDEANVVKACWSLMW